MSVTLTDLDALAKSARPLDDDDWGSDRQIEAENAFFGACEEEFSNLFDEDSAFADFALKATSEERIDKALRLVRKRLG
ncbi:hypothetical protein [Methylobacterium flocculans]|uniref:hypothetical protein n=1 Tax=Methylobacterium flocculans TaxID=2984843 RepID=UPI0021F31BE2|nr:hypothetical protein [Methylobacterium sp. FF17]